MGQLILVRHGQASFGSDDYDVLSDTGWAQGRALGAWLAGTGVVPTALVTGGMRRHRETAEAMVEAAGWTGLTTSVDAGWDEFDHLGVIAGYRGDAPIDLDRRAFQALFEEATAAWTAGETGGDGETFAAFVGRVREAMGAAVGVAGSGATVVVVSSGGPIAAVCADLVDPASASEADGLRRIGRLWSRFNTVAVNAAMTRVVVGSTGARLLTFNEHAHVSGELLTYR